MNVVVDGNNLAYRIWVAYPYLTTQKGKNVSVVYGFIKNLRSIVAKYQPETLVVAWDGKSQLRTSVYPEYKSQRAKNRSPEEAESYDQYIDQMKDLVEILSHFGVHQCKGWTCEADDIIAYFANDEKPWIIISEDKDMLQLVSNNTSVYRPISDKFYTHDTFVAMVGLTPRKYLQARVMMGDTSDNIQGVNGIGEVTAFKLMTTYNGLTDMLGDSATLLKSKRLARLVEGRDILVRNMILMDLRLAVTCLKTLDYTEIKGRFDAKKAKQIFIKYEFFSYLRSMSEFLRPFEKLSKV